MQPMWADRCRPRTFGELTFHGAADARFKHIVARARHIGNMPHLCVYGPAGAGKRTRVLCLVQALMPAGTSLYGTTRLVRVKLRDVSTKRPYVYAVASAQHLEVTPTDATHYAGQLLTQVLQDYEHGDLSRKLGDGRGSGSADSSRGGRRGGGVLGALQARATGHDNATESPSPVEERRERAPYLLVVHDVHRMDTLAQRSLLRIIERRSHVLRVVLVATTRAGIDAALLSRCYALRVGAPSDAALAATLRHCAHQYAPANVDVASLLGGGGGAQDTTSDDWTVRLARVAEHNATFAITLLENRLCRRDATQTRLGGGGGAGGGDAWPWPSWRVVCAQIAESVWRCETSPAARATNRRRVYDLFTHCITPSRLVCTVAAALHRLAVASPSDDGAASLVAQLADVAAHYEHQCVAAAYRHVVVIEAYLAHAVAIVVCARHGVDARRTAYMNELGDWWPFSDDDAMDDSGEPHLAHGEAITAAALRQHLEQCVRAVARKEDADADIE